MSDPGIELDDDVRVTVWIDIRVGVRREIGIHECQG